MTATFPTFKGLDIGVKRSEMYSTSVQVGASGKEQRASFQSTPRFQFELTLNFLRQAGYSTNTVTDELATLQAFFESMLGQWGTFNFTDTVDGTVRLCRFAQDNMDVTRIGGKIWDGGTIKLITVK